jgi:hypothetical protein
MQRLQACVALVLLSGLLTAAKPAAQTDEELYYPSPLQSSDYALITAVYPSDFSNLPKIALPGNRFNSDAIWVEEKTTGNSEVKALLSKAQISDKNFCNRRDDFETSVCRIAKAESLARATAAAKQNPKGLFVFTAKQKDRIRVVFNRTKKALLEVIHDDAGMSAADKNRITARAGAIELSELSFETDLSQMKNEAEREAIRAQCLDSHGRFLYDNSFLRNNKIYLCPFHIEKAFTGDHARPEDFIVLNLAHLLAHSADYAAFRATPPTRYSNAMACYAKALTAPDDPYWTNGRNFRRGTDYLCCRASKPDASGVRSCTENENCDITAYMPEIIADQLAFGTLGQYIRNEQDYSVLKKGDKFPAFAVKQSRDTFSRNMYIYCDPAIDRREDKAELDPDNLFVNPRRGFRLSEARKNAIVAKAIFCSFDRKQLTKEFGELCWDTKGRAKNEAEDE